MRNESIICIPEEARGVRLSEYLAQKHILFHADCGGRGVCGNCRAEIVCGRFFLDKECTRPALPDREGTVRTCCVYCGAEESQIRLCIPPQMTGTPSRDSDTVPYGGTHTSQRETSLGLALDIGTTTLVLAMVDLDTESVLKTISRLNPQAVYGADVLSRILAIAKNQQALAQMRVDLLDSIKEMLSALELPEDLRAEKMTVTANTTMLHIFCGVSPVSMGTYPFLPSFTEKKIYSGRDFDLPVKQIIVLPSVSAFIGADIVSGVVWSGLAHREDASLLIDLGTNGEIVLCTGASRGGLLYAASAAAGPAFEGAGISSGIGAIDGAVCHVGLGIQEQIVLETINGGPPIGICGSGLIDMIAALLKKRVIGTDGCLPSGTYIYALEDAGQLSLNAEDIRVFQLAKSAVRAAIEVLITYAGLTLEDIRTVYIAGGMGYHMRASSAIDVGLLPSEFINKVVPVGNSALEGAIRCLYCESDMSAADEISALCKTVDLTQQPTFTDAFMRNMSFPNI